MSDRVLVATRKGLFQVRRHGGGWSIGRPSFRGDPVTAILADRASRTLYAGLWLGHYGVKLWRSSDDGETWHEVGTPAFPPQSGGVEERFADGRPWPMRVEQLWALEPGGSPGELWCGTVGGGLFRSSDAGESWRLVHTLWNHPGRKEWMGGGADLPGLHSICVDPKDPRRVLVGVSTGGAWLSEDDGETWRVCSHGMVAEYMPPERRGDPLVQDPHRIVQCPSAPERLWCQHHNGVFRSDDRGVRWHQVTTVVPAAFGFAVAVHPEDPDTAWLVPAQKDDQRLPVGARVVVARTRDGGKSWTALHEGLPAENAYDLTYRHALDVAPSGERLAFGSTTGNLWLSEDGGDSWTALSHHLPPIYAVRFA
jgi:hypothetical protein